MMIYFVIAILAAIISGLVIGFLRAWNDRREQVTRREYRL